MSQGTDDAPPVLYRYRSLAGNGMDRLREIITQNLMYFSNPSAFNDPFDCRPVFSLEGTAKEQEAYFLGVYSRQAPYLDRAARRAEVRKVLKSSDKSPVRPKAVRNFADFYYANISGRVGLLCLTEAPDDILMWSHYADSHRGVCLGFAADGASFHTALRVRYELARPVVNPIKHDPDEMLEMALLTKARHWEYEREWRVIRYRLGAGVYQHDPGELVEVVMGCQMEPETKDIVRELVAAHPAKPRLLHAELGGDSFLVRLRTE